MKESGRRLDVRLKKPVQLLFVYISAWATEDGVVQFRRDIYQKDGIGDVASLLLAAGRTRVCAGCIARQAGFMVVPSCGRRGSDPVDRP